MRDQQTQSTTPRQNYAGRLEARRAGLAIRKRRHIILGSLRVLVFFTGIAMTFAASTFSMFSLWWLFVPAASFWWLGQRLELAEGERTRFSRAVTYYERALARLDHHWTGAGEKGERFLEDHHRHLYASDLALFGRGSMFELLCHARTPMGQEVLAEWLLKPATTDTIRARQDAVAELAPRLDLREDLALFGENARAGVRTETLYAWGERKPLLERSWFRVLAWGLSVLGSTALLAFLAYLLVYFGKLKLPQTTIDGLQVYFLSLGMIYSAVLWRFKGRTHTIIHELADAAPDLSLIAGVLGRLETERFNSPLLAMLRTQLEVDGQRPSMRIAKLFSLVELVDSRKNMAMVVIRPLLLWDIHLSYAIEEWRRVSGPNMRRWLSAVGEMEALESIAGYYYEHPDDVFPEFLAEQPYFEAKGLGHPLLPDDRMVRNDVYLARDLSVLVVSGSNMSGKSTLLRAIGINTVLAQAGAPVRARYLRLSSLAVGASIRTLDSLQDNTSRFYAEITQLRSILEKAGDGMPVIFLIDEVLHGTNSHDRRIGAEAIVQGLVNRGAIGLLTTHDLALAHIAEMLSPRGANVHFEDHLEDGQMHFDYRMYPGVVQKSNALELMRSMGFEV
jgi:hypothetical protein